MNNFAVKDGIRKGKLKVSSETPNLNWHDWMQRWDSQQSGYMPDREQRFSAMLDVLEALLPERFVALDLACHITAGLPWREHPAKRGEVVYVVAEGRRHSGH